MTAEKPGDLEYSFADRLRMRAENARAKELKIKEEAIKKEIDPIKTLCEQAADEGKNEILVPRGNLTIEGVQALKKLGLRVSNFETQYVSITVAWDQELQTK